MLSDVAASNVNRQSPVFGCSVGVVAASGVRSRRIALASRARSTVNRCGL